MLRTRVETYCRRFPGLQITFSKNPLEPQCVSLYVTEIRRIAEIPNIGSKTAAFLPVLAYGSPEELSNAWEAGCADYMKNPWTMTELHFRIDRLLTVSGNRSNVGEIQIEGTQLVCDGYRLDLSAQERKILSFLIRNNGDVVPREALYYGIWGSSAEGSRAVDVHISKLRNKLKRLQRDLSPGKRVAITTIRGEGYSIRC